MVLLTIALLETWAVYLIAIRCERPAVALGIDSAVRYTFPIICTHKHTVSNAPNARALRSNRRCTLGSVIDWRDPRAP
jgi:hypothetical protein